MKCSCFISDFNKLKEILSSGITKRNRKLLDITDLLEHDQKGEEVSNLIVTETQQTQQIE